nr:MAG TPA: hypothetical protein [Caudoviricetes sp.]
MWQLHFHLLLRILSYFIQFFVYLSKIQIFKYFITWTFLVNFITWINLVKI